MKRMLTLVCLAGILVSALALSASAGELQWGATFTGYDGTFTGTTPNKSGGTAIAYAVTSTNVIDDELIKDPRDSGSPPNATGTPVYVGWYRPTWTGGSNPYPLIRVNDYKGQLDTNYLPGGVRTPNPSLIKTWTDLVVWAYSGYALDTISVRVASGPTTNVMPNSIGGKLVAYKLIMTDAPDSYWNDPNTKKVWDFPVIPAAGGVLFDITLPSAGAIAGNPIENGVQTAGYRFSFLTPEPGSLLALGAGLAGFAGLLRRRSS